MRTIIVRQVLNSKFFHGEPQMYLGAAVTFDGRVFLLDELQNLSAVEFFGIFAFLGFPEAYLNHLGNVFLLHVVEVQFLDALHLFIIEPIGYF